MLWCKFSTQKLFLMQNDLFSTVLGRNLSSSAPGLLTWKPVSAFTLIMKLPGPPACYSSTGRRFAMLMVIIIDPPKKKHLPSQSHTSGWMRMREGCEILCSSFSRGRGLPGNVVAQPEAAVRPNTHVWGRFAEAQFVHTGSFCLHVWHPLFFCISVC